MPRTNDRTYGCSLLHLNKYSVVEPFVDNNEVKAQLGWTAKDGHNSYGAVAISQIALPRDVLIAAFQLELRTRFVFVQIYRK